MVELSIMRVLLLNPPYIPNFIRSARSTWPSISGSNWYPIFLAYATGWLIKHGIQAKLVDALIEGAKPSEVVLNANIYKPDLLVLYISQQSLANDVRIGSQIKRVTGCELVLVGPWCSYHPENILRKYPAVDGVVRREFDDVVLDLAKGKKKKDILGLIYRDGEKIISNPERPFLTPKQLDEFPFVTSIYKQFVPIEKYHQASLLHPFVDLFTARGCIWGRCTFCLWPHTIHKGALYRARNIENVMEELLYIQKELPQVKEVFFQDDTLAIGRARELSEWILKRHMKLTWSCYARANMDRETLQLMKQAGCRFLHVGYESADTKVLQNMDKGTDPANMERFTRDSRELGLRIHGDFIVGLPGETVETIKSTIAWAKKLHIEGYQFFIPQPEEGTPLFAWAKKHGVLTHDGNLSYPGLSHRQLENWRFSAMRSMYFSPTYLFETLSHISTPEELYRLVRTAFHVVPNLFKN